MIAGKRKNLVLSIFGALAPLGFFTGVVSRILTANFNRWDWYFWAASILLLLVTIIAAFTNPNVCRRRSLTKITINWWRSLTIVSSLMLITYSLASSSNYKNGYYSSNLDTTLRWIGLFFCCYVHRIPNCSLFLIVLEVFRRTVNEAIYGSLAFFL